MDMLCPYQFILQSWCLKLMKKIMMMTKKFLVQRRSNQALVSPQRSGSDPLWRGGVATSQGGGGGGGGGGVLGPLRQLTSPPPPPPQAKPASTVRYISPVMLLLRMITIIMLIMIIMMTAMTAMMMTMIFMMNTFKRWKTEMEGCNCYNYFTNDDAFLKIHTKLILRANY